MNSRAPRVVVVGAGMVGLATAWHLQRGGVQVTVLDRRGVAAGASWGNAGWLAPALTLPLPEPAILSEGVLAALKPSSPVYVPLSANPQLWRFLIGFVRHCTRKKWTAAMQVFARANAEALAAYDELALAGDARVAEPTHPADPFMLAFASQADRDRLVSELSHDPAAKFDLLDADQARGLEPVLGDGVACGINLHGQRFIHPPHFMASLAEAARAAGVEIITGVDVTGVERLGNRVLVRSAHGRDFGADDVVIATGTWLGRLARAHGVRRVVQAGRGYSFTVHPDHAPSGPIYLPAQRVACTPLGDGTLRIAGMMEFRSPSAPLDPRRISAIVDATRPLLCGIDWDRRTDEWVGPRPCTSDGIPLVGPTRTPRVYVAGGHGMWGIALGPLTGKLLAHHILNGSTSPILHDFDPLR